VVAPGDIDLRRDAGAHIFGEESAMIESIEGKCEMPLHLPPFVAQVGIFNRPTLVHNIETLLWAARICREGPEILYSVEKNGRKGLRSYSVWGGSARPACTGCHPDRPSLMLLRPLAACLRSIALKPINPAARLRGFCWPACMIFRWILTRSNRMARLLDRPPWWSCRSTTAPKMQP
jgi:hypothetical protein